MAKRPNILLIVLDTLRRDRLSAYGYPLETSPELDEFSTRATLFERAVSPAQWTIPAHTSLFTGLYASTHQLTEANRMLSPVYPTLAEILRSADYHTAGFCNNPLVGVLNNGLQRGFNEFFNYAGAAPNRPLATRRRGLPRPVSRRWQAFARAVGNQFAHNDWLFRVSLNPLLTPIWTRTINYKGSTRHSIDDAIAYIGRHRQQAADRPLFVFLNLMDAHLPYRPPTEWVDKVAPHLRRDRAAQRFMGRFNADAARWASPVDEPLPDDQAQVIDGFYTAEIAHQDYHLGRLLRYLRQSGALDDTLVIITADHGEGHGDHSFFGHSFVVYQELVHVPLVVHYPERFPAGRRVMTNVSTRRIFHTVLDIADVPTPFLEGHPNHDLRGLSLARATNCKPDTEGGVAFAEAFPPQTFLSVMKHRSPHLIERLSLRDVRRGVYDGEHKLATVGGQVEGLFHIATDPAEVNDVSAQYSALSGQLRQRIDQFVASAQAQRSDDVLPGRISPEMAEHLRALGYIE